MKSEKVKNVVDNFARLSFILETYVKLVQTGDHVAITEMMLACAQTDAHKLLLSIEALQPVENES